MKGQKILDLTEKEYHEFTKLRLDFLDDVCNICKEYGAKPFLDGGTLLGAIRDKEFIKWDHDMDIGMKIEDLNPSMITVLRDKYYVKFEATSFNHFYFLALRPKGTGRKKMYKFKNEIDIWLDIYFYYPYKDNIRLMSYNTPQVKTHKKFCLPAHAIDELDTIKFYDREFYVPKDYEAWLESFYTKAWRTPDKKWVNAKNWIRYEDYNLKDYSSISFESKKLF